MSVNYIIRNLVFFLLTVFILGFFIGCSPQESGDFVGGLFNDAGEFIQAVFRGVRGGEAVG